MVFLTPFAVYLRKKKAIAVSIVKLEIHQIKKRVKGEMRKISNPSCSSFPCHFLFFTKNILRVNISQQAISLFTQSAYFGDFPLKFLFLPIFFYMSHSAKKQLRNTQLECGLANYSPWANYSLCLFVQSTS